MPVTVPKLAVNKVVMEAVAAMVVAAEAGSVEAAVA